MWFDGWIIMLLIFFSNQEGVKKLIFIHDIPVSDSGKQSDKTNSLEDLGTDLLALIDSSTKKPTSGPGHDGPSRTRPLAFTPAAPTTQKAQKKQPVQDDTNSLTELEKQAEQEVNFMTKNNGKGRIFYADLPRDVIFETEIGVWKECGVRFGFCWENFEFLQSMVLSLNKITEIAL